VAHLLPPGTTITPHYCCVHWVLHEWGLPSYLADLGLLMRYIERGLLAPHDVAVLGTEAEEVAAALVAFSGVVPRSSLEGIKQGWKLLMLTYFQPSASVLMLADLLARIRYTPDADLTVTHDTILKAAHACRQLGMEAVRVELMDHRARLTDPHLTEHARRLLDQSHTARVQMFEELKAEFAELLHMHGINAQIERQPRPVYQVLESGLETARGSLPWADVVEVLTANAHDCYHALGLIDRSYEVVGSKLRDYIGGPKENGYQALHTTIKFKSACADDRTVQVDVRIMTPAMRQCNREGYLAFLSRTTASSHRPMWWMNNERWRNAYAGTSGEMFVFTPMSETVFLPRSATVIDFAVRVHSDLGVYCQGALINGHHATAGEQLACGDVCEVVIDQHGAPIAHSLLHCATTKLAKTKLQRALQKGHSGALRGQQIFRRVLSERLKAQEVQTSEALIAQHVEVCAQRYGYHSLDAFYRSVAHGDASPDQVVRHIIEALLLPYVNMDGLPPDVRAHARHWRLANCCQPRPSQPAVAVAIHAGKQLKIHRADCSHINGPSYSVTWKPVNQQVYVANVLYEGWDRPGLIYQITKLLHKIGEINIRLFTADVPEPSLACIRFSFETTRHDVIEQVQRMLEQAPECRRVDVQTVTVTEDGIRSAQPLNNPYGPQPVGRWPFFIGRREEVQVIRSHLNSASGARHILICGPKRIGKSSLLDHLRRYHLNEFNVLQPLNLQALPDEELQFARLVSRLSEMIARKAGARAHATKLIADEIKSDPVRLFGEFLSSLRPRREIERFVALIDELGVVASRLTALGQSREFFDQWRALLNDEQVYQHLSFVVVMPDISIERIIGAHYSHAGEQFSLRIGELGFPIRLSVLSEVEARELIATPIKTHLEYTAADLDWLMYETGGHPYYTHLVCGQIVTAIQAQQRRSGALPSRQIIATGIVQHALNAVDAHKDAFHHVLADTSPESRVVLQTIAALTNETLQTIGCAQLLTQLQRTDSCLSSSTITRAIEERPDLLIERGDEIGIRVALVARWLRRHT
jgi:(p)ppGpp synthase/HD superfamily hydrolase